MCEVAFSVCPECTQLHMVKMEYCEPTRKTLRREGGEGAAVTVWRIRHGLHWSPMGDCRSLTVNKVADSKTVQVTSADGTVDRRRYTFCCIEVGHRSGLVQAVTIHAPKHKSSGSEG